MKTLYDSLSRRILILDGGLGTLVQGYGLEEADYRGERFSAHPTPLTGCYDILPMTRPDVIGEIHESYLRVGADIISTDTLNANAVSLADYSLQDCVYEFNRAAAELARGLCDKYTAADPAKPRYVAGSVGSTNRTASLSPDLYDPGARSITFDELAATYRDQIRGLLDGGAQIILIETSIDTLNIKAALYALDSLDEERGASTPVMVSGTLTDASGRLLSGQTLEAFYTSVRRENTLSVGLNCGFGADQMFPYAQRVASVADCAVAIYPNAGLPNGAGGYDETPESMAESLTPYFEAGLLNIVGGCCGTTPAHITAIAEVASRYQPRPIPKPRPLTRLSGLEDLNLAEGDFVIFGDRASTDNAAFAEQIRQGAYESALYQTSSQLSEGAQGMAVCLDADGIEGEQAMRRLLNLAQSDPGVSRVPLLVDSYRRSVLTAGLSCVQGRSLGSALSLKKGDEALLTGVHELRRYGALPVIRLADEQGPAETLERKTTVAARAYTLLKADGTAPEEIVFDLLLSPLGTEQNSIPAFLKTCAWIQKNCPGARPLGRIGECTRTLEAKPALRAALHAVLLYEATRAGLAIALMDPAHLTGYEQVAPELLTLCRAVISGKAGAVSQLLAYEGPTEISLPEKTPTETVELLYAWLGERKIFLPGLLRYAKELTAKVKEATTQPPLPAEGAPRVVLPSLSGDAGELGKNLAIMRFGAKGYAIENIAGKPLPERIVNETIRSEARALVLPGNLPAAREEVIRIADTARRKGLDIPLLVWGPAFSREWAEQTLQARYGGPVQYAEHAADLEKF